MKSAGRKITMLTAYDFAMASLVDAAEIEGILVGDSMSMVVQGHENTALALEARVDGCGAATGPLGDVRNGDGVERPAVEQAFQRSDDLLQALLAAGLLRRIHPPQLHHDGQIVRMGIRPAFSDSRLFGHQITPLRKQKSAIWLPLVSAR